MNCTACLDKHPYDAQYAAQLAEAIGGWPLEPKRGRQKVPTRSGLSKEYRFWRNELVMQTARVIFGFLNPFMERTARMRLYRSFTFEDAFQEAILGLLYAVDRYDPAKGFAFSTYALYWVRQRVRRERNFRGRFIRLPANFYHDAEIYRALPREVQRPLLSLDRMRGNDEDHKSLGMFSWEQAKEEHAKLLRQQDINEACGDLRKALKKLNLREQFILCWRFGIGCKPFSLEEVGDVLGVSRERVRQIEERAKQKLAIKLWRHKDLFQAPEEDDV